MTLSVTWIDHKRESRVPPNPIYPNGADLDMAIGALRSCQTPLPYPALRCGHFNIECSVCGLIIAVTTAGRPDDPRSVRVACKKG